MSEEKKNVEITKEDKKVSASRVVKGRKSINYLQKLKDEGTPIVQMCPAGRDQFLRRLQKLPAVISAVLRFRVTEHRSAAAD